MMQVKLATAFFVATIPIANAGQLSVVPPNAIVAVPPTIMTPAPSTPYLGQPSLGGETRSIDGATDINTSTASLALTAQILQFDVQQLSPTQAQQAIPLLERLISSPPVGVSADDIALLGEQLATVRSIVSQ